MSDEISKHRSSKNTRRWCGGKKGREHTPECRDYGEAKNMAKDFLGRQVDLYRGWKILICTTCGKELDTWFPATRAWHASKPKPDWVR